MVRCRTRLLPSGSNGWFCHARALIFITLIRGGDYFDPYQRLSGWTARPPSPGQPTRPFIRDDPDDVGQVAAAFATALLDREQAQPSGGADGVLDHGPADPSAGCKLIDASSTVPVLAHLV